MKSKTLKNYHLVLVLNKRLACGLNVAFIPVFILCLIFTQSFYAQDTVALNTVEVSAKKITLSQIGKKTETLDSTLKENFRFNSIAEVVSFNTPVFIKSYGPGGIATTSFRGGNASQTAVLWNGFNLQNAMLGQSDLALIPSVLFEQVDVEYGGSSSLFGSGAVGGSIHLNTTNPFNAGFRTATHLGAGSFGMGNASTKILYSGQRFVSSTKLYVNRSDNTFKYYQSTADQKELRQQKHADYLFYGGMQEFKFLISARQLLTVSAWLNSNVRNLPAFDPSALSKTSQLDQAQRIAANWNYFHQRFKSTIRAGFFNDVINYSDSLAAVYSKSRVQTVMLENENYLNWHSDHQLNLGVNVSSSSGKATNYDGIRSQHRVSLLVGNKFSFIDQRLTIYLSARAEYFSNGALPITGNVSADYQLFKYLTAKINVARVYRQPTLNDLYWQPGGNPALKPEQGYTYDGELKYKKQIGDFLISVSGAVYSRKLDNWILWVPGANGNPKPMNVQQVWSRGTETSWRMTYTRKNFNGSLGLTSGYVLSTVEKQQQENSATLGRQLIYTPRYTVNGNISVAYRNIQLIYFQQYLGYRFTTSDNSSWLDPYHLSSLKLNYSFIIKSIKLNLFAASNNLFSANYVILAGRPMPLVNYEFGISVFTHKKLKQKINNNQ